MKKVSALILLVFVLVVYMMLDDGGIDSDTVSPKGGMGFHKKMAAEYDQQHEAPINIHSERSESGDRKHVDERSEGRVLIHPTVSAQTHHYTIRLINKEQLYPKKKMPYAVSTKQISGTIDQEVFRLNVPNTIYEHPDGAFLEIVKPDGSKVSFSAAALMENIASINNQQAVLEMDSQDPENYDYYEKEIILPPKFN